MNIELQAMWWLRFDKNCHLAFFGRSPRSCGIPDVIGITASRYLIEVEIKRSVSDFRANERKPQVLNRELQLPRWPKLFYFCVPENLVPKVEEKLPPYAGLLSSGEYKLRVVKPAQENKESQKLSVKECSKLLRVMGNQILSTETRMMAMIDQQVRNSTHEDIGSEYQI